MWIYLAWFLIISVFIFIVWFWIMICLNKKRNIELKRMILNFDGKDSEILEIRELIKKCAYDSSIFEDSTFFITFRKKAYDCEDTFKSDVFTAQYLLMKPE